jgi:hypothetical protein
MKKHLLVVGIVFLFVGMGFQPAFANIIENKSLDPPLKPTITGPDSGKPGQLLTYVFNIVDPDSNDWRFHIEWGDGNTEWTIYVPSGTDKAVSHTWNEKGAYTITAYAQDGYDENSSNATKTVTIPRDKQEDCDCQTVSDVDLNRLDKVTEFKDLSNKISTLVKPGENDIICIILIFRWFKFIAFSSICGDIADMFREDGKLDLYKYYLNLMEYFKIKAQETYGEMLELNCISDPI